MLGMLGQVMTGVADNVMVGWTGATPLAAASFGNTFYSILLFFCVGVSYAITPLVARATGAGDIREANAVLRHGLMINVVIGALVTVLIFAMIPMMYHMGQPPEVVDLAIPYIGIIALAIIPTMVFQSFRQFCEGLQRTRMAMVVVIGSNLVNIVLNYLFIFGKGGFAEMGLYGAGLATFIARCVMGGSMALYVYFDPIFRAYRPGFAIRGYSRELISRLLHIGLPAGAQYIFEAGAFGLSAIMMGWIGTVDRKSVV